METIKSIIFDWGGVLIDDPNPGLMQYCATALRVGRETYIEAHSKFANGFQKGAVCEDEFWDNVCSELNAPKPNIPSLWAEAFEAAYVPRNGMFSMASSLQENGYRTAVLSNTEVPAMQYFHQQQYDMFDVLVFSCAEGIQKPDRRIYELTLEKLGSQPRQSILIDDNPEYINGAKEVGINTVFFENIEQVNDELNRLGVKIA
ncbi:MAG: HAD-IA family hydrolase [Phycisphaerae bacterium]|nr:HAD family phosphatase [Phycisphaerae bacterium]NIP51211.1 HAD family phosphatase [Phycisphaerae bacterium]NIS50422.1 HAD family phosphatase [Phycisphaerae bacterium]NIU08152.1 HAD family phosphatase [Phycisphaerae bacterium]NIU55695.1 HAD-IA family hydrolase [Phycisphaerae bacterium]